MANRCLNCGAIIDDSEIKYSKHSESSYCPECCSEDGFVTVERCKICDEYYNADSLTDGVCNSCMLSEIQNASEFLMSEGVKEDFAYWILEQYNKN